MPEKTAGPFPLDQQFDRRDVTEDLPGHPIRLGLRVVDKICAAVPGAAVEIWHADATGDYSAFTDNGGGKDEGAGTTFLRGTQIGHAFNRRRSSTAPCNTPHSAHEASIAATRLTRHCTSSALMRFTLPEGCYKVSEHQFGRGKCGGTAEQSAWQTGTELRMDVVQGREA